MTEAERTAAFWAKVDRSGGPGACWPWLAAKTLGYGSFWNGTRVVRAHTYAWVLANGPMPEGRSFGCHKCDNPPCCNPAHIFPGTNAENQADSRAKGRSRLPPPTPFGEDQHLAKLTTESVREIRRVYMPGDPLFGARPLARRFGVTHKAIALAVRRETWKHVS